MLSLLPPPTPPIHRPGTPHVLIEPVALLDRLTGNVDVRVLESEKAIHSYPAKTQRFSRFSTGETSPTLVLSVSSRRGYLDNRVAADLTRTKTSARWTLPDHAYTHTSRIHVETMNMTYALVQNTHNPRVYYVKNS